MHAASVYPEPGSNSPKRCTTLRSRLLSEGLTTRTSLSRISCHSSVVKVQRPRREGPRRRRRMMGLGGRGVKPGRATRPGVRTVRATSGEAARGRMVGTLPGLSNGSDGPAAASDRQPTPPGSIREAGLDEQDEGGGAEPAQQRELDRAGRAERPDEDQRRGRSRAARRCRPWPGAAGSR